MSRNVPKRSLVVSALCATLALIVIPTDASAESILFTYDGSGTGKIGTTPFVNAAFTITAVGDTDYRIQVSNGIYFDNHNWASISINGVGAYQLVTETRTFVNKNSGQIGFSRAGQSGYDLFSNLNNEAFSNWNMLTSVGPITGPAFLKQWTALYGAVETTGGTLFFNEQATVCTFRATLGVVPEPSTLVLLGASAVGLLGRRRQLAGERRLA